MSGGSERSQSGAATIDLRAASTVDQPEAAVLTERYVTLAKVGAGGMGTVFRAYDSKLRREVALKRLRPERFGEGGQARLVREARAMAQLSHPNVVAVYDVDFGDVDSGDVDSGAGGVSIAMELVDGITLRRWLEDGRSYREILDVFRQAGEGIAAAHRAGMVHRDFKPSNVLIAQDGRVKVTDFGLAKSICVTLDAESSSVSGSVSVSGPVSVSGAELVEAGDDPLTQVGTVVGTPKYMAPEQLAGEGASVAADQYAFCLALWEALSGAPAFAGRGSALAKAKRDEAPSWSGVGAVPDTIVAALRRGLAPGPSDRWDSMEGLLSALADERWARRRRRVVGVGVLLVVCTGVYGLGSAGNEQPEPCTGGEELLGRSWGEAHRDRARAAMVATELPYARQTWTNVDATLSSYGRSWADKHREICLATVRSEQSPQVMDLRMACMRRVRVEFASAVERFVLADPKVVENSANVLRGLPRVTQCDDLERLRADSSVPRRGDVADAVEAGENKLAEARSLARAGNPSAAREVVDRLKESPALAHPPFRARYQITAAAVESGLGNWDEAAELYHSALATALELNLRHEGVRAARSLGFALGARLGRADEGILAAELALNMARGLPDADATIADALIGLGGIYYVQGRMDDAGRSLQDALSLGDFVDDRAGVRMSMAMVLTGQGHHEDAERELIQAIAERDEELGRRHPDSALIRVALAFNLSRQGRNEDAEPHLREAIGVLDAALGPQSLMVAQARSNLGAVLEEQGRLAEAEVEHRQGLAAWEKRLGADGALLVGPLSQFSTLLRKQGKLEQAQVLVERAWAIVDAKSVGVFEEATAAWELAAVLEARKVDPARAHRMARRAHDLLGSTDSPDAARLREEIGRWLEAQPASSG